MNRPDPPGTEMSQGTNASFGPRGEVRDNSFDLLRLFAAFCVVVQHAVHHLNIPFLWLHPGGRVWFYDGVPLFFIVSGFLVYRSCRIGMGQPAPVRSFYWNRFLRIGPALYAYVVIAIVGLVTVGFLRWADLLNSGFIAWLSTNFLLAPVYNPDLFRGFGVGVLNGSLWTIPAEVGFYLLLPVVVLRENHKSSRRVVGEFLVVAVLLWVGFHVLQLHSPGWLCTKLLKVTPIPYLVLFGLGMIWEESWNRIRHRWWFPLLALVGYVTVRYWFIGAWGAHVRSLVPLWAFPLSYLVIWLGSRSWGIGFVSRWTGDLSYGTYVWHMPVLNTIKYLGSTGKLVLQGAASPLLAVLGITLVLAKLSWTLVEKPALRLKTYTSRVGA